MQREPIFNVPAVIVGLLGLFAVVHVVREVVLTAHQDVMLLLYFAFIPARFDASLLAGGPVPGGVGAQIWTFVTYAFLHGDWMHLGVNSLWMLAFGSAVARRFGAIRFLAFFAVTAAAGALAHLMTYPGSLSPMIGASAAISGAMAAAIRFVFQRGGPLGFWRKSDEGAYHVPALPLSGIVRDGRVLTFLAVWFGMNFLFGIGTLPIAGADQVVAWQAHIGGFVAGLLLFALFDPRTPRELVDYAGHDPA